VSGGAPLSALREAAARGSPGGSSSPPGFRAPVTRRALRMLQPRATAIAAAAPSPKLAKRAMKAAPRDAAARHVASV